jgi:hypothetical protein
MRVLQRNQRRARPADCVPRRRPRSHVGLRSRVAVLEHAVLHWRGGRCCGLSKMGEGAAVLDVRRDHVLRWHGLFSSAGVLIFVVLLVIVATLSPEVCRSLVFVWIAILGPLAGSPRAERGGMYIGISRQRFANVSGRKLVQLLVVAEDDDGNIDRTQDRQLMRLLEEAAFSLEKSSAVVSTGERDDGGRRRTRIDFGRP